MGPSGSGKSTLLRLLNFLETPESGTIAYKQKIYTPNKIPDLDTRREITTVLQRSALLKTTVWKNVIYPLKLRKINITAQRRKEIENLLDHLGLAELKGQQADTLSGGEAQRVAMARAIVFEPNVLLLDEPTSNLDPTNISILEKVIKRYIEQKNKSIIMVTHNILQAKRLTDRVGLLYQGQMIEVDKKEKFFNDPAKEVTKKFLEGELIY